MVYNDHAFPQPLCFPWFYRFAIYTNYVYTSLVITNPDRQITEYLPIYFPPIWYYRFNETNPPQSAPIRLPADIQLYILRFLCDSIIFWPHFFRQYNSIVHPNQAKRACTNYFHGETVYQITNLLASNNFAAGHLILQPISPFYDDIQKPPLNTVEYYQWRSLPSRVRTGSLQNPTSANLSHYIHELGPFECLFHTYSEQSDPYTTEPELFTKPTLFFWRDNHPLELPRLLQIRYKAPSYLLALYGTREYSKVPNFRHLHPTNSLYYCAPSQTKMVHDAWTHYYHTIFNVLNSLPYPPNEPPPEPNTIPPLRLVPLSEPYQTSEVDPTSHTPVPRNLNHTFKDQFPFIHAPIELPHITREQSSFSNYDFFRYIPSLPTLQDEWKRLSQPSEDTTTQYRNHNQLAHHGHRPPPTFVHTTSFSYQTTLSKTPNPETTFGVYDTPQNLIMGRAFDTIPAYFFFDNNLTLHHILPKISYHLTQFAELPCSNPFWFDPAHPEPEIVDAFIINHYRFVEQLHPVIRILTTQIPHIAFVRLCRYWFAWNPHLTPAMNNLIDYYQPFFVDEMYLNLRTTPHFDDYESSVQLYWRMVQPPDYPRTKYEQANAVFRHFITTASKHPISPESQETFWTVTTAQPSFTYPYAWDETLTLEGHKPTQPSQGLCTIPQDRFYDLAQSDLPYLPEPLRYNQRPTSSNPFLPILVHTWIPHPHYPQLEAPNNAFNRCSQGIRQAVAIALLEDSIWEDLQIQQPQLLATLESVFHRTMTAKFFNLLVDPIALCDYLNIRREDVYYRWQDNTKRHTKDPNRFSLDYNDRYQFFVKPMNPAVLQEAYSRRAKRFSDWPRLRSESRRNQTLPDPANP